MSKAQEIELKTEELLKPILDANKLELVDVEYVKEMQNNYLKIIIDKDGGVFVDDCELVSRAIEPILDKKDFIKDEYILEVSSPGLDRKLRRDSEFTKYAGRLVDVKLFKKTNGLKEFQAELIGLIDGKIVLKNEDGEKLEFNKEEVAVIKLAVIL